MAKEHRRKVKGDDAIFISNGPDLKVMNASNKNNFHHSLESFAYWGIKLHVYFHTTEGMSHYTFPESLASEHRSSYMRDFIIYSPNELIR